MVNVLVDAKLLNKIDLLLLVIEHDFNNILQASLTTYQSCSKPFFNLLILSDLYCSLTKLSLKENCLSDTGVRKLTIPQRLLKGGLGNLSILDLSLNPSITDNSIKHIMKLNSLTALNLSGTKVTFGYGVPQLMNHTNLCLALDVSGTNIHRDNYRYTLRSLQTKNHCFRNTVADYIVPLLSASLLVHTYNICCRG